MAISVNWLTRVITVPRADLQLIQSSPTEIRQLSVDAFRLELKALEADLNQGMPFVHAHEHTAPIGVGGVQLARVVSIVNGYTVTFEDGAYAVNIVGANSNIGDVVNVNNVSVRSANSAGLTYSKQVEDSSFTDARVWIDTGPQGQPGTQYPRGTPGDPVSNLDDAQAIISARDLPKRLHISGTVTLASDADVSGYNIIGESVQLAELIAQYDALTDDLVLQDIRIEGDLNGNLTARRATSLTNLVDFDGTLHGCGLAGTIRLATGQGNHEFIDCYSQEAGLGMPVIDVNGIPDPDLYLRRYSGSVELRNVASGNVTVGFTEGRAVLDSTCTGGTIVVRGTCELVDNSAGSTVIKSGTVTELVKTAVGVEIDELRAIHGLIDGSPLVVSQTSRAANGITQSVVTTPTETTVTRQ